jgi:GTP cyclohydrolase I
MFTTWAVGLGLGALRSMRSIETILQARHLCMMMLGVEKQHSSTVTSSMLGAFREEETRDEFLALIRGRDTA